MGHTSIIDVQVNGEQKELLSQILSIEAAKESLREAHTSAGDLQALSLALNAPNNHLIEPVDDVWSLPLPDCIRVANIVENYIDDFSLFSHPDAPNYGELQYKKDQLELILEQLDHC